MRSAVGAPSLAEATRAIAPGTELLYEYGVEGFWFATWRDLMSCHAQYALRTVTFCDMMAQQIRDFATEVSPSNREIRRKLKVCLGSTKKVSTLSTSELQ